MISFINSGSIDATIRVLVAVLVGRMLGPLCMADGAYINMEGGACS
jgi:hypothetical protein